MIGARYANVGMICITSRIGLTNALEPRRSGRPGSRAACRSAATGRPPRASGPASPCSRPTGPRTPRRGEAGDREERERASRRTSSPRDASDADDAGPAEPRGARRSRSTSAVDDLRGSGRTRRGTAGSSVRFASIASRRPLSQRKMPALVVVGQRPRARGTRGRARPRRPTSEQRREPPLAGGRRAGGRPPAG